VISAGDEYGHPSKSPLDILYRVTLTLN
jgi:hypothetical protein